MSAKHGLRILLADDEPIVQQTLGGYLRDSGHEVDEAADGASAERLMGADKYDIAIVDVRMPGMDGMTLLKHIRDAYPDTSVTLMTAYGNADLEVRAKSAGAVRLLRKPIDLLELDEVLDGVAQGRQSV